MTLRFFCFLCSALQFFPRGFDAFTSSAASLSYLGQPLGPVVLRERVIYSKKYETGLEGYLAI